MKGAFKGLVQVGIAVLATLAVPIQGCSSENGNDGMTTPKVESPFGTITDGGGTDAGCTCSGTGISGPVTVSCGATTCGADDNTYLCNSPGGTNNWTFQSSGCGGGTDAGTDAGGCTCSGTGISGPVTVACGQTTCGADDNTYMCNSPGGNNWSFSASGCAGCTCTGTGISGPVTVACGSTTCGADDNTYLCNSPGGANNWTFSAAGCAAGSDGGGGTDGGSTDSGFRCQCSGTGSGGPVTVNCGDTTCGTDNNTYVCNAPGGSSGWAFQSTGCGTPCTPLTACPAPDNCGSIPDNCGSTVFCGGACSGSQQCVSNQCQTVCQCTGTGLNGPVTVNCGQTACGADDNTYLCNSPGGSNWTLQSVGCSSDAGGGG